MQRGHSVSRVGGITLLAAALAGSWPLSAQDPKPGRVDWAMVETIVSRIEPPRIPARTYRVADFGALGAPGPAEGPAHPSSPADLWSTLSSLSTGPQRAVGSGARLHCRTRRAPRDQCLCALDGGR